MINVLFKRAFLLVVSFLFVLLTLPVSVKAQAVEECTEAQLRDLGVAIVSCNSTPVCATSNSNSSGKVFVLGDSLTVGMRDTGMLENKLRAAGHTVTQIDGTAGISIPNSLPKIDADAANVTSATKVVIELGTNDGNSITTEVINQRIKDMVQKVKSINTTAQIYWVNVHSTKADYSATNTAIASQSTALGFQLIDWDKYAASNMQPSDFDSLGVHPQGDGYAKMSDLVVQSIGASTSSSISGPGCCSSTNLVGGDNEAKVYNYFISKELQPFQAAGFMGNMKAEAHFEPRLVEYGWNNSRGEESVIGEPSSLDDNVPPDQNDKGQPGYGIIQWTSPGRKQGLRDLATAKGIIAGDLGLQLEYMWQELNGGYKSSTLDPVLASTSVEEATDIVLTRYEIPGDIPSARIIRTGFANEMLIKYGSGVPTVTSATSTQPGCGASGTFSYGRYASLSRQELVDIILNSPSWKPQSQNPTNDIQSGIATDNLLRLIAALIENVPGELITPSVIQTGHTCRTKARQTISNHMGGLAVDLGGSGHSPESMAILFMFLYTNQAALGINELIFDPVPTGTSTLKHGEALTYDDVTLAGHADHIHVSIEGPIPTTCPAGSN